MSVFVLKSPPASLGEPVFVPHRLVEKRQVSGAVRGRHRQEVGMPEREHLRIDRIAHEIHPGASDDPFVPDLFARAAIGDHFLQRGVVPQVRVIEDHRHRLEVPPAGSATKAFHEFGQDMCVVRDHLAARFTLSPSGCRGDDAEGYRTAA